MKARIGLAVVTVVAILLGAAYLMVRRPAENETATPAGVTVADFTDGVCTEAAAAVIAMAAITRQTDPGAITAEDRARLATLQRQIWDLRAQAPAEVRDGMTALVLQLGYLRVRLDSRTAEPAYLEQAEAARARLESSCVEQ